ncbi:MAG: MBOAT family protein [Gammaproteobacteria bacterium]|nr:MBOAT family protein [Gammaproteobacteria bacterium]
MVFSSAVFLFLFLPLVIGGHFLLRGVATRNVFLLVASLIFYSWGEVFYVFVLLLSIAFNTFFGVRISRAIGAAKRNYLITAVASNLILLGSYKYANFIIDNLNLLLGFLGTAPLEKDPVHLPLGISFFTFQAISYVVDVYRGDARVQKRFLEVALYISLFPQLIAGPIVRYGFIEQQLTNRITTLEDFGYGVRRFVIGLAKKILIANTLGQTADDIFDHPTDQISTSVAWLGIASYALQIYFDFSGYSDMAIGLGRMFGFRFPENFNHPYISTSVREFWRRWHITLSTWFRDYVYIPLGGNRAGGLRVYGNLLIVFLLVGLWHGASWSFVIWGLYHGSFLVLERLGFGKILERLPAVLCHLYLLLVVTVGWVFFRSEDLGYALDYLSIMGGISESSDLQTYIGSYLNRKFLLAFIFGVVFSAPIYSILRNSLLPRTTSQTTQLQLVLHDLLVAVLFVLSALAIAAQTYNPFIYFRF